MSAVAIGSRSRYRTFPGKRKKANLERYVAQQPPIQATQIRRGGRKAWRSNVQAVNSDVSFFGDYDDDRLQRMAETMRSAAIEDASQSAQERQIC